MEKTAYGDRYGVFDFALLGLDPAAQTSDVVKMICLPSRNVPHIGSQLIATGWGQMTTNNVDRPVRLQYVELTGNSVKDCAKELATGNIFVDPNSILCAGYGEKRGTYDGDSGGFNFSKGTIIQKSSLKDPSVCLDKRF